jgi:putative methionine-R-sulfoxide reductase with GAF domain
MITGFIRKNLLSLLLVGILGLIAVNAWLIYQNRQVIARANTTIQDLNVLDDKAANILNGTQHGLDLGVRGYYILRDTAMLFPYNLAIQNTKPLYGDIEELLTKYRISPKYFDQLKPEVDQYIVFMQQMRQLAEVDSTGEFKKLLKEDRGLAVWKKYMAFKEQLATEGGLLTKSAQAQYQAAMDLNIYLQLALFLVALPVLGVIVYRLYRQEKQRDGFIERLVRHTRRYLFDDGQPGSQDPVEVFNALTSSLQTAAAFVSQVAQNNLNVGWHGLTEANKPLNADNLAGNLMHMRDQLRAIDAKEKERGWATEGQAQIGDILSTENAELAQLAYSIVSTLVKYLGANQGGLFVVNGGVGHQQVDLTLAACYAYGEKRLAERTLQPGESLVGQAYLEKATMHIGDLPEHYSPIASGLGQASPRTLLIVPLKLNQEVFGVIELASLGTFAPYQVAFVESISENIAATLANVQNAERNRQMLHEAQVMTEQLRSQEEEMRQNMEELMATQDEMARKQVELVDKQKKLEANEQIMKRAYEKMREQEKEAKQQQRETQELNEALRSQEEELRQNMEELMAGQEEMARKQAELEAKQKKLEANEQIMKRAYEKMREQEKEAKRRERETQELNEQLRSQEEELRQNMEELMAGQEEMARKQAELEFKSRKLEANEQIMKRAYEKTSEKEKQYRQTTDQLRAREAELQENVARLTAMQEEMAQKQAELAAANAQNEAQKKKLATNEQVLVKAVQQSKEAQARTKADIEALRQELAAKEQRIAELLHKLNHA